MRIALVVHKFPPASLGGTEIYTRNLARTLSQTHDVTVFYRDDDDGDVFQEEWQERDGFRAWRVGRAFDAERVGPISYFFDTFFNPDVERSFGRFLDAFQPDLVHFQHLMLLSFRLIAKAKELGLPCLLTLHDYWFICSNSQLVWPSGQICNGKALGLNCVRCATARMNRKWVHVARPLIAPVFQLRDALVRRAARRADQLVAPSGFLIRRYGQEGFSPDRFVFLENGLDVDRVYRSMGQKRHQGDRHLGDDKLRVTYLGSLAWQKGVHVLVEAFRDLPPDRAILRIFGSPKVFPDYAAALRARANFANTSFEGTVPNDQVGGVLAETDVLAVPSLWYENSPVVIQEARAAGVPVIAADLGALSEKVRDEVDGLLLPPGDVLAWHKTLSQLVRHRDWLTTMRANVPAPVTVDEHIKTLVSLYHTVSSRQLDASVISPTSRSS